MELVSKNSMMAVSSTWGQKKTFRLIPVTKDSTFSEGIYDIDSKVLILMSGHTKEQFHMITKMDDDGMPVQMKNGKTHHDGSPYKKERKMIQTCSEYFISDKEEIKNFLSVFVFSKEFNYDEYLNKEAIEVAQPSIIMP